MHKQTSLPVSFFNARDLGALPAGLRGGVVAVGNFDGVHLGHAAVIGKTRARAAAQRTKAVALTFEPHPRAFFMPEQPVPRLSDTQERLDLLHWRGLQGAVVLQFDAALAAQTAEEFVANVLVDALGVKAVVVGHDFHFGKGRGGTPDFLRDAGRRHGFDVAVVEPQGGDTLYSSTAIRDHLKTGNTQAANAMLGYRWFVSGVIGHGHKRGRDLGFPTANMVLPPDTPLAQGIYAVRMAVAGGVYEGVASFGRRPTFDNGAPVMETWLFDFDQDIYGENARVEFASFIRPELKFASVETLVAQMRDDAAEARGVLAASSDNSFLAFRGRQ
jgi:riboflavin kinase / FMN adenylyltransferase